MAPRSRSNKKHTNPSVSDSTQVTVKIESGLIKQEIKEEVNQRAIVECPICFDNIVFKSAKVTMCGHVYCDECLNSIMVNSAIGVCAICKNQFYKKSARRIYL